MTMLDIFSTINGIDSTAMSGPTKERDNFQSLVQALSEKLGPCSGIDSDDVDERELQQLMQDYISDESEWAKYFFPSSKMAYTRNLVDKGNGKSNLVCYTSGTCG
jgi:cysteine dioxygenase